MHEAIYAQLQDPDSSARLAALEALGQALDPDNLACLIQCLKDPEIAIRIRSRRILVQTTHRDYGFDSDAWTEWWQDQGTLQCHRCSRHLFDRKLYYRVKAQVTSEPRDVVIHTDDAEKDHQAEIEKLCEELSRRDAQDIEDEVYVNLVYYLCLECKKSYVREVRKGP